MLLNFLFAVYHSSIGFTTDRSKRVLQLKFLFDYPGLLLRVVVRVFLTSPLGILEGSFIVSVAFLCIPCILSSFLP